MHDDVAHKALGKGTVCGEQSRELLELGFGRQFADEEQIDRLLKAVAMLGGDAFDQIADIDTTVAQLTVAILFGAFFLLGAVDRGNFGKAGKNALTRLVTQAAFDIVFDVLVSLNVVVFNTFIGEVIDIGKFGQFGNSFN